MRILQITPGSGDSFYCENCVRDVGLIRALRRRGHDVIMVPLYLPVFSETVDAGGDAPVFFGGLKIYLQQRFPVFRHAPPWLGRLLDSPRLLGALARRAGSTRASGLGAMTFSLLQGEEGNHRAELGRLIEWIASIPRPDLVHISNALLLGLAGPLRRATGAPVVCSLQDEDGWVDALEAPFNRSCWDLMGRRAGDVAGFVAVSRYYAGVMAERLGLPEARVRVVHVGIECDPAAQPGIPPDPPAIGYLSRLAESRGLDVLIQAYVELRKIARLRNLRLRVAGGSTRDDTPFIERMRARVRASGAEEDVEFLPSFDRENRRRFFSTISVLSVPLPRGEAFGTYLLEAMAAGVPVVQPKVGAFVELVEATGGGVLYEPRGHDVLVSNLAALLLEPGRARSLGLKGREAVLRDFTVDAMAAKMEAVYAQCAPG